MDDLLRATARAESRHFWFRGFRAFVLPLVAEALSTTQDHRILDCGCGTGANVALLSRYGPTFGFDLSPTGIRLGREAGRTRLVRGSVTAAPFPSASFDLVTSFDVLYSLDEADEHAAVAEMFRLVRAGGFALINVAAMEMLRGDHSVLSQERRRYSRASLRALLVGAGFTIVRLTYTNAALFVPLAALRTVQRLRGLAVEEKSQREISVPPAPVNALLTAAVLLESVWLRYANSPFGSSLLCLARKPV